MVITNVIPLLVDLYNRMINFDNLDTVAFDRIEFQAVETSAFDAPTPVTYNEFLKRPEYDTAACRKQFLELVGINTEGFYQFVLFVDRTRETAEIFGFNYLKSRTITPLRFSPSPNFELLVDTIIAPFDVSASTLSKFSRVVGSDGTGGGCSVMLVDMQAFIENPDRYLEMHAPECYSESETDN